MTAAAGSPANNAIVIMPAARSDTDEVAALLANAFAVDPHTVGLLPQDDRDRRLVRMFGIVIADTFASGGHVWIAADADGGTKLGAALWDAPGASARLAHRAAAAVGYLRVFGRRMRDAAKVDAIAAKHRPTVPHWYLKDLGTHDQARGRGVASALLRHRLAVADEQRIGTYLESSTRANVPFYRKHGFVERTEFDVPGTTPLIGMWRPESARRSVPHS